MSEDHPMSDCHLHFACISKSKPVCVKVFLRQRTKQRVKFLWRQCVLSRQLLQKDQILKKNNK